MIVNNNVSIEMDGYQKLCDTNKNVIKMGMIIKWVYFRFVSYQQKIWLQPNTRDSLKVP
jgi:hypothetical protein